MLYAWAAQSLSATFIHTSTGVLTQALRAIATAVAPYSSSVLFYLAAAVSDFYVPWDELAEHKIQSTGGDGNLTLHLAKVDSKGFFGMYALGSQWTELLGNILSKSEPVQHSQRMQHLPGQTGRLLRRSAA